MIVLDELFLLSNVSPDAYHPLTPKKAGELVLAAVLAPLVESNLAAPVEPQVFAMDASPSCGAVCHVELPEPVAETLWTNGEWRGGYTRLEAKARAALRSLGSLSPWVEGGVLRGAGARCPAGGAGGVGALLCVKGYVALNIDLALSQHFDMQDEVPLRCVIHMIERRRVGVIFLEPPCTDFFQCKTPGEPEL